MTKEDYYNVLGVDKNASQEEIKRAFRHLARKYHPDVAGKDSEEKFKEINEAFQILSDPQKRSEYDQFGHTPFRQEDFSGFRGSGFDDLFKDFGFGDIFDIFSGFKGRTKRGPEQGADLRYDLEISLENSFSGLTQKIEVPRFVTCKTCDGTGAKSGFLKTCPNCNGTGEVRKIQRSIFGQIVNITTCTKCGGSGKVIEKPCSECNGSGRISKLKIIDVKIPKGVDTDSYLRVTGQGEEGYNGGPPGDLYVVIHVKPHPVFDRYENDLFCETTINLRQAILGSEIEIPTINSKAKLKIPAGTQSHSVFRLKGQGMPDLHTSKRGNQMVKIVIKIPEKLNKKQKKILKEFMADGTEKIKTTSGFFDKMKEYL